MGGEILGKYTSANCHVGGLAGGLEEIVRGYDLILVDMWGTVYDRDNGLYPEAAKALHLAMVSGRKVFLTSNAARPAELEVERQLGDSLPRDHYDEIITAGGVLRQLLASGVSGIADESQRYFMLGHERNAGLLTGDGYEEVSNLGDADFIVVAGLGGGDESCRIDDASWRATEEILNHALTANLPLFACKADWLTVRGDGQPWIGPGPLLSRYIKQGGTVRVVGKPGAIYYRHCLDIAGVSPTRTLAIGDHIETDIAGATAYGINSVLIRGGMVDRLVHPDPYADNPEFAEVSELAASARSTFELARLRW